MAKVLDIPPEAEVVAAEPVTHRFQSGRTLEIQEMPGAEALEVRAPGGDLVLKIELTAQGPVLRMSGARLELDASDTLSLKARNVEVEAGEKLQMLSAGKVDIHAEDQIDITSTDDVRVVGEIIYLN